GAFAMSASVADLMPRVTRMLAGENLDGISRRYPSGEVGTQFAFLLEGPVAQQSFALFAVADETVTLSIDVGGELVGAVVTVEGPSGYAIAETYLFGGQDILEFDVVAGEQYRVVLEGDPLDQTPIAVTSTVPLMMLNDPDHHVLVQTRTTGLL